MKLGPPDELLGAGSFARNLQHTFAVNDAFGVRAAADNVLATLANVHSLARTGSPYIEPSAFWDYADTFTILAPLQRDISPKEMLTRKIWRASIYTSTVPLDAAWAPTLTVIGADGLPATGNAGNVLRPSTTLGLSFRLPPSVDGLVAAQAIERTLTADPPYGASVTVTVNSAEGGWDAPATAPWLAAAMDHASSATFGRPARALGEGGSIPFMRMLGERFPQAQFMLTGVLGPESNAHGPNEFLHLPTGRNLTAAVAIVLDAHARR